MRQIAETYLVRARLEAQARRERIARRIGMAFFTGCMMLSAFFVVYVVCRILEVF